MKRTLFLVALILLLSGCITPTPPPPTPTLAPTPTPIPLSDIDLSPLLIQEGDLPAGYSGAQIRDEAPAPFNRLPETQNQISQELAHSNTTGGRVSVFVYDSLADRDTAYSILIEDIMISGGEVTGRVGESDYTTYVYLMGTHYTALSFTRCGAVVNINLSGRQDQEAIIAYARRLDQRLEPIICR